MEAKVGSELTFAVFGLSGVAAGFFAGLFGIGGGSDHGPGAGVRVHGNGRRLTTRGGHGSGNVHGGDRIFGGAERLWPLSSGQRLDRYDPPRRTLGVVGVAFGSAVAAETPANSVAHFRGLFPIFRGCFDGDGCVEVSDACK